MPFLADQFTPLLVLSLMLISLVGGMARGFSGFGAGLIIIPVASALISPKLAVIFVVILDFTVTLPLVPPAIKKCDWPSIIPTAIGTLLFVPIGVFALVHSEPLVIRWGISITIILMLGLLLSGWKYPGKPHLAASLGVGGITGFLAGVAQIPGPPIVTYWLSGPLPATIIRANLIVFFFFEAIFSGGVYFANGLFSTQILKLVLLLAPTYALAIWIGAKMSGKASERAFRTISFALIAIAAITSIPTLDPLLRPA